MPLTLTEPGLDIRLDALCKAQPYRVSRSAMAAAILEFAVEKFESTGDPDAWRKCCTASSAQHNSDPAAPESVSNQSTSAPHSASDTAAQPRGDDANAAR